MKKYSGAEIVIKLLERQGIDIITGIPGGSNLPIYDALRESTIKHVLCRHEQGAGFIAQGMARSTGKAAVCMATSGPGAANLITAIADARADSIPLIAITGQVPSGLIGTDAFQEVDMYGMTVPISKHNFLVRSTEELLSVIPEAFTIALSGRPGPVLIDIPKDVQSSFCEFNEWPEPGTRLPSKKPDPTDISRAAEMITSALRPILYIGGGVINGNASELVTELAHLQQIPVTATLMGLGAIDTKNPLFLGMLGMHGAEATNHLLEKADLLISIGVRFDDRATGMAKEFCRHADIIHVDIDPSEINKIKKANLAVSCDALEFLTELLPKMETQTRKGWIARVDTLRKQYPEIIIDRNDLRHPLKLIRHIGEHATPGTIITTDVGQHQMWTAQGYPFSKPRTLLTSGGLGTMGFGMPAAIGASLANPGRKVICISGDGSILMNIQELATMAEQQPNVVVIIMNNGHLGLVRQQQELFYNKNITASRFETNPDFCAITKGFGIDAVNLGEEKNPMAALDYALNSNKPWVVNVPVAREDNVYPMVPPGAANREMIGGVI